MSSNEFELSCSVRTDFGKGASRRLRRLNDSIPVILYGGNKDPQPLTILHKDIAKAIENEAFFSHIITLNISNKKEQAVIKDLHRHPAKPFILHADFQRVRADQEITVNVPIHFLNEDQCPGVKTEGGTVLKTMTEIEVECLPKDLPEYIEVDLIKLAVGDSIHLSEVALPAGVISVELEQGEGHDQPIVIMQAKRIEEVDEPEEGEVTGAAAVDKNADESGKDDKEESSGDGDDS